MKITDEELARTVESLVETGGQMTTGRYDEGMAVSREVLGDSYVERASAKTTDVTRDFQRIVTEFAWGTVWSLPGLDRRSRSAVYCGVPAANAAFRVAPRALDAREQQHDSH
ncbi:hypothetical protein [Mycobacterium sp.]|uniref:hypothetical protein n=1 Tax=Mycobacterium sp. TaxID=1785 RepID=UPI0031CE870C